MNSEWSIVSERDNPQPLIFTFLISHFIFYISPLPSFRIVISAIIGYHFKLTVG